MVLGRGAGGLCDWMIRSRLVSLSVLRSAACIAGNKLFSFSSSKIRKKGKKSLKAQKVGKGRIYNAKVLLNSFSSPVKILPV